MVKDKDKCDEDCVGCDFRRFESKHSREHDMEQRCNDMCPAGKPCMRTKGHEGDHECYAWCGLANARWKNKDK